MVKKIKIRWYRANVFKLIHDWTDYKNIYHWISHEEFWNKITNIQHIINKLNIFILHKVHKISYLHYIIK